MKKFILVAIGVLILLTTIWGYVRFFPSQNPSLNVEETTEVTLFYYNPEKDKDASGNIMCSPAGLVPVTRTIPRTDSIIEDTITLLIRGQLSQEERNQGITTEYPLEGLFLLSSTLENNVLTLHFDDPNNKTGGGSCRVGILWSQIEKTARQFSEVEEVRFSPEELFQP